MVKLFVIKISKKFFRVLFFVCLCLWVWSCVCVCVFMCVWFVLCISVCLFVCVCLCLCMCFVFECVSVCVCVLCLRVGFCLCLFVCLCVSLVHSVKQDLYFENSECRKHICRKTLCRKHECWSSINAKRLYDKNSQCQILLHTMTVFQKYSMSKDCMSKILINPLIWLFRATNGSQSYKTVASLGCVWSCICAFVFECMFLCFTSRVFFK